MSCTKIDVAAAAEYVYTRTHDIVYKIATKPSRAESVSKRVSNQKRAQQIIVRTHTYIYIYRVRRSSPRVPVRFVRTNVVSSGLGTGLKREEKKKW